MDSRTQREKVLTMLRQGPVTSEQFLAAFIPRYSARIFELRGRGHRIEARLRPGKRTMVFTLNDA